MDEQEEFEFRLRLEREREASKHPHASPEWQRKAAISATRAEHPVLSKIIDVGTGASGMLRGALDAVSGKADVGSAVLPTEFADRSSGAHLAGAILDPGALAIGGGVARALPYAPMLGKGMARGFAAAGKNALGGATTGGVIGGLSDEGSASSGATIGAAANMFLPPTANAFFRAPGAIRNFIRPSGPQLAARAAGDKTDDVIQALTRARSGVPGMELTAGQAAVPANSAEFSAFQKFAAAENPSLYFGPQGVLGQQQAARRAAVQSIGKTPKDLADAVTARRLASEQAYRKAASVPVKPDAEFRALEGSPYFRAAAADVADLAEARGVSMQNRPTEYLHLVKESLDKRLGVRGDTALKRTERRTVTELQKNLVAWLGKKNPAYEAARAQHEQLSRPISQMELGQKLEQRLVSPTGAERPASLAQAVRDAATKTNKASGRPFIEALTPQQRSVVNAMVEDIQRDSAWKGMAAEGMKNMKDRVQAWQSPPTGVFWPLLSAARSWFNRISGNITEQGVTEAAELMSKNPQQFAQLMQQFSPSQRRAVAAAIHSRVTPVVGPIVSGVEQSNGT